VTHFEKWDERIPPQGKLSARSPQEHRFELPPIAASWLLVY
jgi:hypothetical protein